LSAGRVLFVGCGPGAADLLTLRAVRAIESADAVIWNAAILDRDAIGALLHPAAELVAWPPATEQDIRAVYDRALAEELLVVRLKGGDPTLFGALEPELSAVRERGLPCEIVPGVSALGASTAALQREVATAGAPLLLVDARAVAASAAGRQAFAVHGASRDAVALQRDLLALGVPATAPCEVAIEVSRPGEMLVSCPLADLAETICDMGLGLLTLVLVDAPPA
jgi:precorrin-4/cobalt-precorrin-4 C11-methyltransferase